MVVLGFSVGIVGLEKLLNVPTWNILGCLIFVCRLR